MLDNPTLLAATGLSQLMLAVVVFFYSKASDGPSLRLWMWGALLAAASVPLFVVPLTSLAPRAMLATAMVATGFGLQLLAVLNLVGLRHWQRRGLLLVGLLTVYELNPLLYGLDNARRIFWAMLGMVVLFLLFALAYGSIWRRGSRLLRLLAVTNLVLMLVYLGRAVDAGLATGDYSFYQPTPRQALIYLLTFIGVQLNGFGFVFALKERSDQKLQHQAMLDPLTDTLNRRAFLELAQVQLASAQRSHQPVTLLMCDIDYFKRINDSHGHAAGDLIIRHLVGAARSTMRVSDSIGRWGGEEFVLLLPNTSLVGAEPCANRLRQDFADRPVPFEDEQLRATVSIGVAEWQQGESLLHTIERADQALYQAKAAGRNRVELAG